MLAYLKKFFFKEKKQQQEYLFSSLYDYLGHAPADAETNYIIALTHSSFTKKIHEKNERLEFLGDAVISFVITEYLFFHAKDKDEGALTKMRASIVNRKNLNKVGNEIGIPKYLRHKLADKQLEQAPDIIGNAFEALIGAFFLDYGMQESKLLVCKLLVNGFDSDNFHKHVTDPKSYLIEWVQSQKKQINFVHQNTPDENGLFMVTLLIDGEEKSAGKGKNKREAEYNACVVAIKNLELT
jgi:ribonuclease III